MIASFLILEDCFIYKPTGSFRLGVNLKILIRSFHPTLRGHTLNSVLVQLGSFHLPVGSRMTNTGRFTNGRSKTERDQIGAINHESSRI